MKHSKAITQLSIVPVRAEPSDRSEQVTQLLFGECLQILAKEKQWLHIQTAYDQYQGYIDSKQCTLISENTYQRFTKTIQYHALDSSHPIILEKQLKFDFPIIKGSVLPNFNNTSQSGIFIDKHFIYTGRTIFPQKTTSSIQSKIKQLAINYLHAPYLWGGRTPFGIDCSGFTQIVYKLAGIHLLRDASQQATQGKLFKTLADAQVGDLAFFANKRQKITHVGIIFPDKQIIHASGQVRIDLLDERGIFNRTTQKYTHELAFVKQFIEQ